MLRLHILLVLVAAVIVSSSIMVDLSPGKQRCVGQELDTEDQALFTFGVMHSGEESNNYQKHPGSGGDVGNPNSVQVYASITDPTGLTVLSREKVIIGARPKEVTLSSVENRGVHKLCFDLQDSSALKLGQVGPRVFFFIDFKSRTSRGKLDKIPNKVGKEDLPTIELHLKSAEESLHDISKEIEFAQDQELLLKEGVQTANDRIRWFGYLSMTVLLLTSLWQLLYLRSFFKGKKLL